MPKSHSVERDVTEFCGWDKLLEIVKRAEKVRFKAYPEGILPALVAALFETGGRISEVLGLKRKNFDLDMESDFVIVKNMLLVKRKKGSITSRTFPIKRGDPLWPILESWIKPHKPDDLLFNLSRSKAFVMIRGLGRGLYPHWFRAQRASQLALEYGWDVSDLSEFFAWKHFPTALRYAHRGYKGLAERMR